MTASATVGAVAMVGLALICWPAVPATVGHRGLARGRPWAEGAIGGQAGFGPIGSGWGDPAPGDSTVGRGAHPARFAALAPLAPSRSAPIGWLGTPGNRSRGPLGRGLLPGGRRSRSRLVARMVVAAAVVAIIARLRPPLALTAALLIAAGTAALLVRSARGARHRRRAQQQYSQLLRMLAADLGSGSSLPAAIRAAMAAGPEVQVLLADLMLLCRLHPVTPIAVAPPENRWASRHRARANTVVGSQLRAAVRMSLSHGVPLGDLLHRLAEVADEDRVIADRIGNQAAGARFSGYVLGALPVAGVALGMGMGANPLPVLLGGGTGAVLLIVGVILTCAGLLWSARLVR